MITMSQDGVLALDLSRETPVQDAMLLSLCTPLGALFQRLDFGSEIPSMRNSPAIVGTTDRAAENAAIRSLQWMVDLGLIREPQASAALSLNRLSLAVVAKDSAGSVRVDYWIPVPHSEVGS